VDRRVVVLDATEEPTFTDCTSRQAFPDRFSRTHRRTGAGRRGPRWGRPPGPRPDSVCVHVRVLHGAGERLHRVAEYLAIEREAGGSTGRRVDRGRRPIADGARRPRVMRGSPKRVPVHPCGRASARIVSSSARRRDPGRPYIRVEPQEAESKNYGSRGVPDSGWSKDARHRRQKTFATVVAAGHVVRARLKAFDSTGASGIAISRHDVHHPTIDVTASRRGQGDGRQIIKGRR